MSYPTINRIPIPTFQETRGKHYLSVDEVKVLLSNPVVMEEKIDGKIDATDVESNRVFFEFMKYKHTIPYTKLPSWQMAFDVWNGKRFLDLKEKTDFLTNHGFSMVRKITYGNIKYEELLKFLPKILALQSAYGDETIEGIIIKNYEKQLFGKIVNPKFEEEIERGGVHWTKKPVALNRLLR